MGLDWRFICFQVSKVKTVSHTPCLWDCLQHCTQGLFTVAVRIQIHSGALKVSPLLSQFGPAFVPILPCFVPLLSAALCGNFLLCCRLSWFVYSAPKHPIIPTPRTVICTLNTAHYTMHTSQCILHTAHCTPHTANCTKQTAHSPLHTAHCLQQIPNTYFNRPGVARAVLQTLLLLID